MLQVGRGRPAAGNEPRAISRGPRHDAERAQTWAKSGCVQLPLWVIKVISARIPTFTFAAWRLVVAVGLPECQ